MLVHSVRYIIMVFVFLIAWLLLFVVTMSLLFIGYIILTNYLGKDDYSDDRVMRNGRIMNAMKRIPYS